MPAPRVTARVAPVARAAAGLLPAGARARLLRRVGPLLGVPGADRGLVSVVVVCQPVDLPRLGGTLRSLRHDAHGHREVLVAPVGTAYDGARAAVAADRDPRLRVLRRAGTWQEAANLGAAAARGRFLVLRRGCDPHAPGSLADLTSALAASGSDLAVGAVEQRGRPARWLARTTAAAHARPATGLHPAERPALAGDLGLGNVMLRLDRWRAEGRRLGPSDGWLLSPTLAAHLAGARQVDVLARPVQVHLGGHGVRAFDAAPSPLRDLAVWGERADEVGRVLAGTPLAAGWRRHLLDVALPGFLLDAERATASEWETLRRLVARHVPASGEPGLGAEARSLLWLAGADRRHDLAELAFELDRLAGDVPTVVADGGVLAVWEALPADLPTSARALGAEETPLVAEVVRRREAGAVAEVDLVVRVDHVDLGALEARVEVAGADGRWMLLDSAVDPAATRWAGSRFHRALAATATVPAEEPVLRLRLLAGPLERRGETATADPHARPATTDPSVQVGGVRLEEGELRVDAAGAGRLRLVDDADRVVGSLDPGGRLVLREVAFGRERWLPTGHYRLVGDAGPPLLTDRLRGRLPLEQVGPHHRLRATVGPAGGLLLHLGPPLADDELGPHAQRRLVVAHAADRTPPDPAVVYFESYAGRSATDSPRAIHDGLLARGLGHTTYWGVLDHAQWVPQGARPVLLRSRAWYDVLARAGGLVVNTDVEEWFRRRPGQVLLQTFHGYPSKGMGLGQWRAAQLSERRIAVARARGVDTWSAIVTPTPAMTRHYREQYGYTGPAFEHGYPRDDELVGPGTAERRESARRLLGIGERTAVLYAPTWRENLATRARRADLADHLDVARAARALGDGHVVLFRGHRFHQRRDLAPGVLDVTDHPEVNDLVLAADVVVLDYSSLRFDVALAGRPMVFLVPDLADYAAGTRRFLFPFEDSAPGPFVEDTDGVVAQVRDVVALRERWAPQIEAFNATFHPFQDGRATERVVDGLLGLLAHPTA